MKQFLKGDLYNILLNGLTLENHLPCDVAFDIVNSMDIEQYNEIYKIIKDNFEKVTKEAHYNTIYDEHGRIQDYVYYKTVKMDKNKIGAIDETSNHLS